MSTATHQLTPRERQLAFDPIPQLVIRYSIPAIIGMLVNALYNVVDRFWIGQLNNTNALSGIGLTLPMSNILLAFIQLVAVGATASISLRLGARQREEAEKLLGNALTLCLVIGLAVSLVALVLINPMLLLFGASSQTLPYARSYAQIILLGNVFNTVGFALNHSIRGSGNPRRSASTQLLGAGLNIILDPLFIFVFRMDVAGAAIATIISQFVSMLWVLSYFRGSQSLLRLRLANLRLQSRAVRQIMAIGVAPFSMQISTSLVTILANRTLRAYGGDVAIGAMTIVSSMSILFMMPLFGINQGLQPILGYNYGAGHYARVRTTWATGVRLASAIVIFGFLIVELFPAQIIRVFIRDPALIEVGIFGLRAFLCMMPLLGFQIISTIYFQSIGKSGISMLASLLRQVIFLIPLYLLLPRIFGFNGVWYASPAADLLSFIVTAILMLRELSRLRSLEQQHQEKKQAQSLELET